jgi:glycosyltransferase involved in cell wall biosynthesis
MLLANASSSHDMTAAVACVDDAGREGMASHVQLFKLRRRWKLDPLLLVDTLTAIDRFQPDVVHAWLPAVVTIPAMVAARLRRVPVLFSYRVRMKNDAPLKPLEFMVAASCATGVISNTKPEWCSRLYQWLYRRKRGLLIANGVVANPRAHDCLARTVHEKPLQLLFAGRLSTEKNWPLLLQAMPQVVARCDARLTICGRGEHQAQVEKRIAELDLQDRVSLVGYQRDLRSAMERYDALVMPSLCEGMPNVVLEAMAAGLPCILSDIPEHRMVCGGTNAALLFDLKSAPAVVDAVCSVVESVERRLAMSDAGLKRSAEFSVSHMAAKHGEAYRWLLASANGKSKSLSRGRPAPEH